MFYLIMELFSPRLVSFFFLELVFLCLIEQWHCLNEETKDFIESLRVDDLDME